jgi:hypothetical protein
VTKQDFVDWKNHPVTETIFRMLRERMDDYKDQMVFDAVDGDPRRMAYNAGIIHAFKEVLNTTYEESHGD